MPDPPKQSPCQTPLAVLSAHCTPCWGPPAQGHQSETPPIADSPPPFDTVTVTVTATVARPDGPRAAHLQRTPWRRA